MKIEFLDTFADLIETRNFNRTAARLCVTQSTVSMRIRSLEEAIGVQLFIRGRSGAELTPEGRRFESYATNLRLCWNQARQDISMPRDYQGRLRIATQVSLWPRLISKWVFWLRQEFPKTAIHVEADYSKTMIDELSFGNLDIAVIYTPQYRPELEIQHLFNERFVMVASEPQTLAEINVESYVLVAISPNFVARHGELLPQLQLAPVSMGLGVMSVEYLRGRGGAAYLPADLAQSYIERGEFFPVADAPQIEQPVFVSFLSKNRHRPQISKALKALRLIALD
ncbi:LysR family transcriptional regulator [Pseudomonas guariconensis]|uniref:LysR family transcriptional regulator n=1 Tax=Pseudomonas guariconensis TaxID=1288410 RepID=UPI002B056FC1|nr:LysR family transcriptional regulator [Pseudomonas guariconensis]